MFVIDINLPRHKVKTFCVQKCKKLDAGCRGFDHKGTRSNKLYSKCFNPVLILLKKPERGKRLLKC